MSLPAHNGTRLRGPWDPVNGTRSSNLKEQTGSKATYEDVASGWFALAAQMDCLELERAHAPTRRQQGIDRLQYRCTALSFCICTKNRYTGTCGMLFLLSELPLFACLVVWVAGIVVAVASLLS